MVDYVGQAKAEFKFRNELEERQVYVKPQAYGQIEIGGVELKEIA